MKNVKQYYKELGRLIYAIAISDGVIQREERENLHQFVLKNIAHYEKEYDSSGMNKAFYIDFSFDEADATKLELNGSVNRFCRFLEQHREADDDRLLELSIALMQNVANAYSKKREKFIIDQVKNSLQLQNNK